MHGNLSAKHNSDCHTGPQEPGLTLQILGVTVTLLLSSRQSQLAEKTNRGRLTARNEWNGGSTTNWMIDWINQIFSQDIFVRSSIYPSCFLFRRGRVSKRRVRRGNWLDQPIIVQPEWFHGHRVVWIERQKQKNLYRKLNGVINNGPVEVIS